MKKTIFISVAILFFIISSVAFTTYEQPKFKNLKILSRNTTKEQMDSIMHHFTKSLGVKCGFCHIRNEETKTWDMASDAKSEKNAARKMMLMTNAINKKYFPSEGQPIPTITCYSCHKGAEIPAALPLPMEEKN